MQGQPEALGTGCLFIFQGVKFLIGGGGVIIAFPDGGV